MEFVSNYIAQNQANQQTRDKRNLLNHFNGSLQNQTEATAKVLQIAAKQTAAQEVAGQQASYYFQDWARSKQLQFGQKAIPQPVQPPITGQQKLHIGTQALQATPDVFVATAKLAKSQRDWNQASQLEDKVLKREAQQKLDAERNPVKFKGDKFYDAFESPQEISQVYKEKLLTPENGDSAHLIYSERFRNTLQQRYGENPFQPAKRVNFLGQDKTPAVPKPTAYSSKTGWIYDDKTMTYLKNKDKPEDLSWIPHVRGPISGHEQIQMLQEPN